MRGFNGVPGPDGQMQGTGWRLDKPGGTFPTSGGASGGPSDDGQQAGRPMRFAGDALRALAAQNPKEQDSWMSKFHAAPDSSGWLIDGKSDLAPAPEKAKDPGLATEERQ